MALGVFVRACLVHALSDCMHGHYPIIEATDGLIQAWEKQTVPRIIRAGSIRLPLACDQGNRLMGPGANLDPREESNALAGRSDRYPAVPGSLQTERWNHHRDPSSPYAGRLELSVRSWKAAKAQTAFQPRRSRQELRIAPGTSTHGSQVDGQYRGAKACLESSPMRPSSTPTHLRSWEKEIAMARAIYTVKFIGRSRDLPSPPGLRRGYKGCQPYVFTLGPATPSEIRGQIRRAFRVYGEIIISAK
jgi:hypothetical protein